MRATDVFADGPAPSLVTTRHRAAAALGASAMVLGGALLARLAAHQWEVIRRPGATPDAALVLGAAGVALALIAWVLLATVAAALSHVPGHCGAVATRMADAWAPPLARRIAGALVGVAVVGAVAPAMASAAAASAVAPAVVPLVAGLSEPSSSASPGFGTTTVPSSADVPSPDWLPTRPAARGDAALGLLTRSPAPERDQVVVRRGDTLWDLARRDLGPDATDAEVAEAWPHWFATNRQVIGPDPGRLRPGQILQRPGPETSQGPARSNRGAHR